MFGTEDCVELVDGVSRDVDDDFDGAVKCGAGGSIEVVGTIWVLCVRGGGFVKCCRVVAFDDVDDDDDDVVVEVVEIGVIESTEISWEVSDCVTVDPKVVVCWLLPFSESFSSLRRRKSTLDASGDVELICRTETAFVSVM